MICGDGSLGVNDVKYRLEGLGSRRHVAAFGEGGGTGWLVGPVAAWPACCDDE